MLRPGCDPAQPIARDLREAVVQAVSLGAQKEPREPDRDLQAAREAPLVSRREGPHSLAPGPSLREVSVLAQDQPLLKDEPQGYTRSEV